MQRLFEIRNKMVKRGALNYASSYFKDKTMDLARGFTDDTRAVLRQYSEVRKNNKDYSKL